MASGLDPLLFAERSAAKAWGLHLASCQGVLTDPARVAHVAKRTDEYLERCKRRLQRAGIVRRDGSRDTKAAKALMTRACEKIGREPALTDTGQISLNRDACILSLSRVLELYADYTSATLIRGRVERMAQGFELPLQTRFDPVKETLRTSSTQPKDALIGEQMQNFPRQSGISPAEKKRERGYKDKKGIVHKPEFFVGLRECFTPRPGCVFVGADYSMAELHTLAQCNLKLFGQSAMAEQLNTGKDLHIALAMRSIGLDYSAYDKSLHKRDRDRAKPANFGFPGGMGAEKFILYSRKGYGVRFTYDEARTLKQQWLEEFPEMYYYLEWISRSLGDSATFTHIHPVTNFVRGGCYYTSGANHGFQHLAAVGAGDAICAVTDACLRPGPLFGWRMWNFVHDEILLEGPLQGAHDAAIELQRIMEEAFNQWVPDCPTTAEPFVTRIWSKQVAGVKDADGRYTPWEPPQLIAA